MKLIIYTFATFLAALALATPNYAPRLLNYLPPEVLLYGPFFIMITTVLLQIEAIQILSNRKKLKNSLLALSDEKKKSQEIKNKLDKNTQIIKESNAKIIEFKKAQNSNLKKAQEFQFKIEQLKTAVEYEKKRFLNFEKTSQSANKTPNKDAAMLLSLLQEEGRLLDFVAEDIASYSDEQVGTAVRIVHQGCSRVFKNYVKLSRILTEKEGSLFEFNIDKDSGKYRLLGEAGNKKVVTTKIAHRGWQLEEMSLPKEIAINKSLSEKILVPAELEII